MLFDCELPDFRKENIEFAGELLISYNSIASNHCTAGYSLFQTASNTLHGILQNFSYVDMQESPDKLVSVIYLSEERSYIHGNETGINFTYHPPETAATSSKDQRDLFAATLRYEGKNQCSVTFPDVAANVDK